MSSNKLIKVKKADVKVMRPPTVAIIDDDAQLERAIGRVLRANYNCVVNGYKSVEDFLATIDRNRETGVPEPDVDLILLDFHLPGRNGPRLVEELRSRRSPILDKVRIMGITGDNQKCVIDRFRNAGIEEILNKPLQKLDYSNIADQAYKVSSGQKTVEKPKPEIIKTIM